MALTDAAFNFRKALPWASADSFAAITPHDSTDMPLTRAIYVGGAGDVAAVTADNTAVTFKAVPVGTILPIRARRVNSTSTTATQLVALY